MTYWGIFIPIKNSSNFRKKSPFESILEKKPPPLSLLKKNPLPAYLINIAKGKTGPRVLTQISIKQIQNFDKALTSKYQPNISISTKRKLKSSAKPIFRILTKIQLRYQRLHLPNFYSEILSKIWVKCCLTE